MKGSKAGSKQVGSRHLLSRDHGKRQEGQTYVSQGKRRSEMAKNKSSGTYWATLRARFSSPVAGMWAVFTFSVSHWMKIAREGPVDTLILLGTRSVEASQQAVK